MQARRPWRRAGRHALPELHGTLGYVAGDRRRQLRARDVEISVMDLRRRREDVRMARHRRLGNGDGSDLSCA